jgi:solute carrier family 38 (sodium-coupled neutral amino acid transporter), member 9
LHLTLFSTNFASLAGVLGIAYFLHPVTIPIVRANKHQEFNTRDVSLGYFYVYLTYLIIGLFGYIGFSGSYFRPYLETFNYVINQNCLKMFEKTDVIAVVLRLLVFALNFTGVPILTHFVRGSLIKVIFGEEEESEEELFV